jgi:hypothetical protein
MDGAEVPVGAPFADAILVFLKGYAQLFCSFNASIPKNGV